MKFFSALTKVLNRKKRNGYYEASQILTVEEKQSLFIVSASVLIPVLITGMLLIVN